MRTLEGAHHDLSLNAQINDYKMYEVVQHHGQENANDTVQ